MLAQIGMAAAVLAVVVVRGARGGTGRRCGRTGAGIAARPRAPGVPLLVRTLTLRAALLLATAVAATRRARRALAAHQVAFTVWTLLALALDAIAIAGAGDRRPRARRRRRRRHAGARPGGCSAGASAAGVLARRCSLWPLASPARRCSPPTRTCARRSPRLLVVAALIQPVAGVVFVLDGVLIGAGDGRYLAWAAVVQLRRVPAAGAGCGAMGTGRRPAGLVRCGGRSPCGLDGDAGACCSGRRAAARRPGSSPAPPADRPVATPQ